MFGRSRATQEVIQSIAVALERVNDTLQLALAAVGDDPRVAARIEELELSRAKWEATMEAVVLKADSTLKAANNAESRARTVLRHAEKYTPEELEPSEEGIPPEGYDYGPGDDSFGEEEGVQQLRLDVETSPKARALRAKFA